MKIGKLVIVLLVLAGLCCLLSSIYGAPVDKNIKIIKEPALKKAPTEFLFRDTPLFRANIIYSENFNSGLTLTGLGFTGTKPIYWVLDTINKNMASTCPTGGSSRIYSPKFTASRELKNVNVGWTVLPAGKFTFPTFYPSKTFLPSRTFLPRRTPNPEIILPDWIRMAASGAVALVDSSNKLTYTVVFGPNPTSILGVKVSLFKAGQVAPLGTTVISMNKLGSNQLHFMISLNSHDNGGDIVVSYSKGGIFTKYTRCITVHDETYKNFSKLLFEYQRGSAGMRQIAIDDVVVMGSGDTIPPTTTHDYTDDGNWANRSLPVVIHLTATDNAGGSGVAQTSYSINGGAVQPGTVININTDGSKDVQFWSVDNAGNEEPHKTIHVKIERATPEAYATPSPGPIPNAAGWYKTNVNVILTATDSGGSGVKEIQYQTKVDTGAYGPVPSACISGSSGNVLLNTDGVNTVKYKPVDNAGNVGAENEISVKVDQTKPTSSASANPTPVPGVEWIKGFVNVTLTADDSASHVKEIQYQINVNDMGYVPAPPIPGNMGTVALNADGVNKVKYKPVDNAGNEGDEHEITVNLDNSPPITQVGIAPGPNAGGWVTGDVTIDYITLPFDAYSGVKATHCEVDGVEQPLPCIVSAAGPHTVKYWSEDWVGNIEDKNNAAHMINFSIDKDGPTVTYDLPNLDSGVLQIIWDDLCPSISATLSDGSGSGIGPGSIQAHLTLGGTDIPCSVTVAGNTVTCRPNSNLTAETDYQITITADDLAGNHGSKTGSFRVRMN